MFKDILTHGFSCFLLFFSFASSPCITIQPLLGSFQNSLGTSLNSTYTIAETESGRELRASGCPASCSSYWNKNWESHLSSWSPGKQKVRCNPSGWGTRLDFNLARDKNQPWQQSSIFRGWRLGREAKAARSFKDHRQTWLIITSASL